MCILLFFLVFGFLLWSCVDVLIYGGTVSLPNFFFKMVYVSWIASHLKFTFFYHFYINMTLSRLKYLFMLILFYIFLFENLWGVCFTCKMPTMYNVYISQEYRKA